MSNTEEKKMSVAGHCPACREELAVVLPSEFDVVLAAMGAFNKIHAERCQAVAMVGPVREKS